MWNLALIALAAALQTGSMAAAVAPGLPQVGHHASTECLGGRDHYAFSEPTAIPDNDLAGVTIGPLAIPRDARAIRELLVALSVSHPYSGELTISLHYDVDRDGNHDASSVLEIYLARLNPCAGQELWACPIELRGTYFFNDERWQATGEVASLKVFEGLDAGGDFYLTIADHGSGHMGIVSDWAIYSVSTKSENDRGD